MQYTPYLHKGINIVNINCLVFKNQAYNTHFLLDLRLFRDSVSFGNLDGGGTWIPERNTNTFLT